MHTAMLSRPFTRAQLVVLAAAVVCLLSAAGPSFAQKPDAELKGITAVGLVVEDVGSQALSCGFSRDTLEKAVSTILTAGGLKVLRNADEDTFLYVKVNSLSVPSGLCVSRFDVTLYTHTNAKLSYQLEPVLVQVSLLSGGGLSGGSVPGHAENVLKSVKQYVDQFVARIGAANK
jgi:hypothetical protein